MNKPIEEILNGPSDDAPAPEPAAAPEEDVPVVEEAATPEETQPKGESEAPEASKGEPPAPEEDNMVPLKALKDERAKRQDAEARLNKVMADKPPEPVPDVIEDPEGYAARVKADADQSVADQKFAMSKIMAERDHDNYAEMEAVFIEAVQENPALRQAMNQHPHPSEFAFQEAKKIVAMQEIGDDPAAFRDQTRKDIEAEVRAEIAAENKTAAEKAKLDNIPQSLTGEVSVADRGKPAYAGPSSIKEILDRKKAQDLQRNRPH